MTFLRTLLPQPVSDNKISYDAKKVKPGEKHRNELYVTLFNAFSYGETEPSAKIQAFVELWQRLEAVAKTADPVSDQLVTRWSQIDYSAIKQNEIIQMYAQVGVLYRLAFALDVFDQLDEKQRAALEFSECSHDAQRIRVDTTQEMDRLSESTGKLCEDFTRDLRSFHEHLIFLKSSAGRANFESRKTVWRAKCNNNMSILDTELKGITTQIDDFAHDNKDADEKTIMARKAELLHAMDQLEKRKMPKPPLDEIQLMVDSLNEASLKLNHFIEDEHKLVDIWHDKAKTIQQHVHHLNEQLQLTKAKNGKFSLTEREKKLANELLFEAKDLSKVQKDILDVVYNQYYKYQALASFVISNAVLVWNPGVTTIINKLFAIWSATHLNKLWMDKQNKILFAEHHILQTLSNTEVALTKHIQQLQHTALVISDHRFSDVRNDALLKKIEAWITHSINDAKQSIEQLKTSLTAEIQVLRSGVIEERRKWQAKCEVQKQRLESITQTKVKHLKQYEDASQITLANLTRRPAFQSHFKLPSAGSKGLLSALSGLAGVSLVVMGTIATLSNPIGWGLGLLGLGVLSIGVASRFAVQAYHRYKKNTLLEKRKLNLVAQQQLFMQNDVIKDEVAHKRMHCPRSTRHLMMACGIIIQAESKESKDDFSCILTGERQPELPLYLNKTNGLLYFRRQSTQITEDSPEFYTLLGRKR